MGRKKKGLLTVPVILWLLIFTVLPLLIMLVSSFRTDQGTGFTLINYINFFKKSMYLKLTWRTIVMSFIVTVCSLVIGFPVAYILAKKIRRGKMLFLALIIVPFFTNQLVRIYSWLIFLQDGGILERWLSALHLLPPTGLGILYSRSAVIIGLLHAYFPYMVITIFMALEKMDDSMLEASESLGASKWTTFWRIIFPTGMPGVISGILIVFVPCLGSFVEPRILGGTEGMVIGTVVESQFMEIYNWDFGAAVAFLLLILVMISMSILSRWGRRYDS